MHPDIRVRGLTKTFRNADGTVVALENVEFVVERGQLFCIVGPSGCGKSTLLRILLGLIKETSGSFDIDPLRQKAGVAYVQQDSLLLPWRTLLQNAALGLELREQMNGPKVQGIVDEIKQYGLGGFENHFPPQLSGGMAQRAALIRAIKSGAALLFCDEPFSAIDFVTRLELNMRFKRMCQISGITTVFVTHNIEEAIFLGDRVLVMSGRPGRVVKTYTPKLGAWSHDAVRCRESQDFQEMFHSIWDDLKPQEAFEDRGN
jgi:NitT/TauT family transport system ATP-binding protein